MLGRQPGKLLDVCAVDIHGAKFYDLVFALDASPDQAQTSRIGQESVYENPRPGDAVMLHLVLGQVTRMEKRD
ncbi:MAG TPA: hypothetical protein VNA16_03605 [Abditibacteriaceae bacterium]|nr:hypothetical protein [Abditibacteriaceae bacterium]